MDVYVSYDIYEFARIYARTRARARARYTYTCVRAQLARVYVIDRTYVRTRATRCTYPYVYTRVLVDRYITACVYTCIRTREQFF